MAWSSTTTFRALTHFTKSDVTDTDLAILIPMADKATLRAIATEVYLERARGSVDGSNTEFITSHKPIADFDFDSSADDSGDITCYLKTIDDDSGFPEFTAATVSTVDGKTGTVNLTTAPTTTTAESGVYFCYWYYRASVVDYDLVKEAANYYLAYMVAQKLKGAVLDAAQTPAFLRPGLAGRDWIIKFWQIIRMIDPVHLKRVELS